MDKCLKELALLGLDAHILKAKKRLELLREEFDRLDANHPHQSVQVAREIRDAARSLETLLALQEKTKGTNETA